MAETEIKIIKGDSLDVTVVLKNVVPSSVSHVYFSSRNLPTKELTYEAPVAPETQGKYKLAIDAAETATYSIGRTSYDITVHFTNNKVQTVRYQGPMAIFDKTNRVDV